MFEEIVCAAVLLGVFGTACSAANDDSSAGSPNASVPPPATAQWQAPKVGTETDAESAVVRVNFGPLQEFQSDAPFYYTISETPDGVREMLSVQASRGLAETVTVTVDPFQSDRTNWNIADGGITVTTTSPALVAAEGTATVDYPATDLIRVDLHDVRVVAYDPQQPDVVVRTEQLGDGWLEGHVRTLCLPLGKLVSADGDLETREVAQPDAEWSTPFCQSMKARIER